jgi:Flp pilus assembly protein CpaB
VIAVLVALAVVFGLEALSPRVDTAAVLVAARDLPALEPLGAADITVRDIARDAIPARSLTDLSAVIGRRPVGPISAGEVITASRVTATAAPSGRVAVPIRFADDGVAGVLFPGDVIDVVADGRVVARSAVVMRIHRSSATASSTVVVVHVANTVAPAVASAASSGRLWATLPGGE